MINLEEYKIALTAVIDPASLTNLQTQIKNANIQPIEIKLNTTIIDNQIKSIRSQIEALKNIKIDLGAGKTSNSSASISQTTAAYKQLISVANQLDKLTLKTGGMKIAGIDSRTISHTQGQIRSLRSEYERLLNKLQSGNF